MIECSTPCRRLICEIMLKFQTSFIQDSVWHGVLDSDMKRKCSSRYRNKLYNSGQRSLLQNKHKKCGPSRNIFFSLSFRNGNFLNILLLLLITTHNYYFSRIICRVGILLKNILMHIIVFIIDKYYSYKHFYHLKKGPIGISFPNSKNLVCRSMKHALVRFVQSASESYKAHKS